MAQAVAGDTLRTVIDRVLASPDYQVRAPEDPWAPAARAWRALLDWFDRLEATDPLAYKALVGVLLLVLAAIVGHAMWIAARTLRAGAARADDAEAPVASAPRDAAWYAAEAGRLAAAGRLAEAMQADFLRLVLELDARRVTRFHPSKTPIEYVHEAALAPDARAEFRRLVRLLYLHAFGGHGTTEAAWVEWRGAAQADRYARAH